MMLLNLLISSTLVLYFFVGPCSAEEKPPGKKGPITITSSTLSADNKAKTALFEGSVIAKTDDTALYSDKMLVFYSDEGKVTKIEAEGDVRLLKGERVVTSEKAVYYAEEEKIIFTGDPKAAERGNVVTGTKITYMMRDDRSMIENSRVFLRPK